MIEMYYSLKQGAVLNSVRQQGINKALLCFFSINITVIILYTDMRKGNSIIESRISTHFRSSKGIFRKLNKLKIK